MFYFFNMWNEGAPFILEKHTDLLIYSALINITLRFSSTLELSRTKLMYLGILITCVTFMP